MSVQNIKGLADIVRQTKASLAEAANAAGDMQATAASVTSKVSQIKDMTDELRAADAELGAAIGLMSNGAPPLETTTISDAPTPTPLPPAPTVVPTPSPLQQPPASLPAGFDIHTRRDRP